MTKLLNAHEQAVADFMGSEYRDFDLNNNNNNLRHIEVQTDTDYWAGQADSEIMEGFYEDSIQDTTLVEDAAIYNVDKTDRWASIATGSKQQRQVGWKVTAMGGIKKRGSDKAVAFDGKAFLKAEARYKKARAQHDIAEFMGGKSSTRKKVDLVAKQSRSLARQLNRLARKA
jgi:hypothetical protein